MPSVFADIGRIQTSKHILIAEGTNNEGTVINESQKRKKDIDIQEDDRSKMTRRAFEKRGAANSRD